MACQTWQAQSECTPYKRVENALAKPQGQHPIHTLAICTLGLGSPTPYYNTRLGYRAKQETEPQSVWFDFVLASVACCCLLVPGWCLSPKSGRWKHLLTLLDFWLHKKRFSNDRIYYAHASESLNLIYEICRGFLYNGLMTQPHSMVYMFHVKISVTDIVGVQSVCHTSQMQT
jgi:hypothetical protein